MTHEYTFGEGLKTFSPNCNFRAPLTEVKVGAWDSAACPANLDAVRTRADKEVAHLTRARLAGADPAKEWGDGPFLVLLAELERFRVHDAPAV